MPDGVRIIVDWGKFSVGASVFVPAINLDAAYSQMLKIAEIYNWTIEASVRIENSKLGVRFWRVL
jgi:hypothetical protein